MSQKVSEFFPVCKFMDIGGLGSIEDIHYPRNIDIFNNSGNLWFLNDERIVLASYPKEGPIQERVVFHPRYVSSENEDSVELIEVRAFTNGRTIDIVLLSDLYHDNETYELVNIKGVGAFGDDILQVDQNSWYDAKENKFVPFESVMKSSLGRRWGLIDTYEAKREFDNNLFADLGLAQVPHVSLNTVPENIFPFPGTSQLVRAINTNVRCDEPLVVCSETTQGFVKALSMAKMDIEYFNVQKELAKENKLLISVMGRIANNRYIDGNFTDMENYTIKSFSTEEEFTRYARGSFMDLIASAYISMSLLYESRLDYLRVVEEGTGVPLTKLSDFNPEIFMDRILNPAIYEGHKDEYKEFVQSLKPMILDYLRSD